MQTSGLIYNPRRNGHTKPLDHAKILKEAEKKFEEDGLKDKKLLDAIVSHSREIYRISAIFPFDLFPDDLVIDENKITFITRDFWKVERVHSVYLKDISDCIVQTTIFFASLNVVDLGFRDNWIGINFLKIGDALRARRIIQGLMVAHKLDLDLSAVPVETLDDKMETLGQAQGGGGGIQ